MYVSLLEFFQFSVDTRISLQSVLVVIMWAVTVIVYMTKVRTDITSIQTALAADAVHTDKQDEELQALALIAERLTTLIDGLTERVERVEHNCDRRHNGG